ncbi:hypothetical protein C8Q73DRAFT_486351 [Cubamyces lactineus]|nr:hypothetical protein C8Q73DRAFT_486351 [Cubamyces lactineus]
MRPQSAHDQDGVWGKRTQGVAMSSFRRPLRAEPVDPDIVDVHSSIPTTRSAQRLPHRLAPQVLDIARSIVDARANAGRGSDSRLADPSFCGPSAACSTVFVSQLQLSAHKGKVQGDSHRQLRRLKGPRKLQCLAQTNHVCFIVGGGTMHGLRSWIHRFVLGTREERGLVSSYTQLLPMIVLGLPATHSLLGLARPPCRSTPAPSLMTNRPI